MPTRVSKTFLVLVRRMSVNLVLALVLMAASLPALAAGPSGEVTGLWSSEKLGFELELYSCADSKVCGRIISSSETPEVVANRERARQKGQRDQPIVGRQLLTGYEADKNDSAKWTNGRIFNPKNGKTYKSTLTLADAETLKLRAYVVSPLFGRNLFLKRMPGFRPASGI